MPSAASKTRLKTHSKENRRCEWGAFCSHQLCDPVHRRDGKGHSSEGGMMVFETVEISSSVEERREESPLVSWAAIVAGAIAAAALDSRSPCFRCRHGLLGRIPVEQFRRVGQHIPNRHRYLSDCRRYARLYRWRFHRRGVCVQNGSASMSTKCSFATLLMAFWHGDWPRYSALRF